MWRPRRRGRGFSDEPPHPTAPLDAAAALDDVPQRSADAARPLRGAPLTVVLITLLIWALVFFGSLEGFRFLGEDVHVPLHGEIVGILLDLMFFTLGVLLLFSGGLILYGSLFTAPETAFLLATPLDDDRVFAHKFQGATAISVWAFLLLGGPILIAYGIACGAPWYFYALLAPFFIGFILLPASLSALVVLLTVNLLPRRRKQVLIACVAVAAALAGWWVYQIVRDARGDGDGRNALHQVLGHFTFSGAVLTPDHWAARGLEAAARGDVGSSLGAPRPGLEQRPFRIPDRGARGAAAVSPGP